MKNKKIKGYIILLLMSINIFYISSCNFSNKKDTCPNSLCIPIALNFDFVDSLTQKKELLQQIILIKNNVDTLVNRDLLYIGSPLSGHNYGNYYITKNDSNYWVEGGPDTFCIIAHDSRYGDITIPDIIVEQNQYYPDCHNLPSTLHVKIAVVKLAGLNKKSTQGTYYIQEKIAGKESC